ncbi:MAG: stage 0 sporulation family protein [Bdellovibrionales bacterium]
MSEQTNSSGLVTLDSSKNITLGEKSLKAKPLDLSAMPKSALPPDIEKRFLRMVGIRFGDGGRVYDFNAGTEVYKMGEAVVAEIPDKGLSLGFVSKPPMRIDNTDLNLKLKKIQRRATDEDVENIEQHNAKEKNALMKVKELVGKHGLPMHILRVEYSIDMRKAMVYFTSSQRVDFRVLLKDLLIELKSRVELRQVGVRDETKMKGGIGPCGQELCCSKFINKFHPVSIKMAKNQNLSLKPTKVSGNCGRLKCCLAYEDDGYNEEGKRLPKRGSKCSKKCGSGGCGIVKDVSPLSRLVTVQFEDGSIEILKASDVVAEGSYDPRKNHPNESIAGDSTTELERVGDKKDITEENEAENKQ